MFTEKPFTTLWNRLTRAPEPGTGGGISPPETSGYQHDAGMAVRRLLQIWFVCTLIFFVGNAILFAVFGHSFKKLLQEGPSSLLPLTLAAVSVTWMLLGLALMLLFVPAIRRNFWITLVLSILTVFVYVNFLREWIHFGDIYDYVLAAQNLHGGEPFHQRYIYPPLLAVLCQPLVRFGLNGMGGIFWLANIAAVIVYFWLLSFSLQRYGFNRLAAPCCVFLFTLVNAPLLRTLGYGQINLHVINLVLLSLLLFPRHAILSGLSLALAVHLKASPVLIAVLFLFERNYRWIISFVISMITIGGGICLLYGIGPWLDFMHNTHGIYSVSNTGFREFSMDNLIKTTVRIFSLPLQPPVISVLINVVKAAALATVGFTAIYNIRNRAFDADKNHGFIVSNGLPASLIGMVIASPLIWVHHPVFLAIPALLLFIRLKTPVEWGLFGMGYFIMFMLPTFDFYPWSYARLACLGIFMYLLLKTKVNDAVIRMFSMMLPNIQNKNARSDAAAERAVNN